MFYLQAIPVFCVSDDFLQTFHKSRTDADIATAGSHQVLDLNV